MDEQTYAAILVDIASGEPAYKAAQAHSVTMGTFWRGKDSTPERMEKYAHAKAAGLERLAEEIMEISDDVDSDSNEAVQRARLRVDSRKWLLSKMAPRKYGDKLELAGDAAAPLVINITGTDAKL